MLKIFSELFPDQLIESDFLNKYSSQITFYIGVI